MRRVNSTAEDRTKAAKLAMRAEAQANRARRGAGAKGVVDSDRVCEGIRRFLPQVPPGWLVLFDALPGEPDLSALLEDKPDRMLALTRTPDTGRRLTIHSARAERQTHRYGFSQPVAEADVIPDRHISCVFVPGLAFDRDGGRLGFGAGYYDCLLSRLGDNVMRVGVTDGNVVDQVPTADHDVAMTHLAGEFGVIELG